jgi:hypothetical protein
VFTIDDNFNIWSIRRTPVVRVEMLKLLFVNKHIQSSSLTGSSHKSEKSLIQTYIQSQRKHQRKDQSLIKLTSSRTKQLEFRQEDVFDVTTGGASNDVETSLSRPRDDERETT